MTTMMKDDDDDDDKIGYLFDVGGGETWWLWRQGRRTMTAEVVDNEEGRR